MRTLAKGRREHFQSDESVFQVVGESERVIDKRPRGAADWAQEITPNLFGVGVHLARLYLPLLRLLPILSRSSPSVSLQTQSHYNWSDSSSTTRALTLERWKPFTVDVMGDEVVVQESSRRRRSNHLAGESSPMDTPGDDAAGRQSDTAIPSASISSRQTGRSHDYYPCQSCKWRRRLVARSALICPVLTTGETCWT